MICIVQLKISLIETDPLVWRRVLVASNQSLNSFAFAVNSVMGWKCSHLYRFELKEFEAGDLEYDDGQGWYDDKKIKIVDAFDQSGHFKYIYDFGDNWVHEIKLEKELLVDPNEQYPKCVGGANACPPEDCGGIHGFAEFKEAIANRRHPRHREMLEWGGNYDPTEFDLVMTNLAMVRRKVPRNAKIKSAPEVQNLHK